MPESRVKRAAREERFAVEYLKDLNGVAALRRMGWIGTRPDTAASKMLARPRVQELVRKGAGAVMKRAEVTVERIVQEAAAIAFSTPADFLTDDNELRPLKELPQQAAAAISDLEFETVLEGSGEQQRRVTRVKKLKRWNKNEAIRFLGQYKGMLQPDAPAPVSIFNIQINL